MSAACQGGLIPAQSEPREARRIPQQLLLVCPQQPYHSHLANIRIMLFPGCLISLANSQQAVWLLKHMFYNQAPVVCVFPAPVFQRSCRPLCQRTSQTSHSSYEANTAVDYTHSWAITDLHCTIVKCAPVPNKQQEHANRTSRARFAP